MIYCITHKKLSFVPPKNKGYALLQVGAANTKERFAEFSDDTEIQISERNSSFCELTGLYWIWKNQEVISESIVGLVHYRRYFVRHIWWRIDKRLSLKFRLLSIKEAEKVLRKYDVILPEKYRVEQNSIKDQYVKWHYNKDLDCIRDILEEKYPDYVASFDKFMQEKEMHPFNMFIMHGDKLNDYCEWLFAVLFEAEKRIDISSYNKQQKRVFGFLAERLFNVYIMRHQMRVKEYQVYFKEDA